MYGLPNPPKPEGFAIANGLAVDAFPNPSLAPCCGWDDAERRAAKGELAEAPAPKDEGARVGGLVQVETTGSCFSCVVVLELDPKVEGLDGWESEAKGLAVELAMRPKPDWENAEGFDPMLAKGEFVEALAKPLVGGI